MCGKKSVGDGGAGEKTERKWSDSIRNDLSEREIVRPG